MTERHEEVAEFLQGALDKIAGSIEAADVFSTPVEANGRVVIAAASVERAGGFGYGAGSDASGEGGGGGGGGGSAAGRPVAVIAIGPDGIEIHPIIDMTRIGIAALAAVLSLFGARRRMRG